MHFLFREGHWKGSGSVMFSHSPEVLSFSTKWNIEKKDGRFEAQQEVVIDGCKPMMNVYLVDAFQDEKFTLTLSNESLGIFTGKGVLNERKIAWEFVHPGLLDGLEVYERISDSEYLFHSEYTGDDGYINKIYGSMTRVP